MIEFKSFKSLGGPLIAASRFPLFVVYHIIGMTAAVLYDLNLFCLASSALILGILTQPLIGLAAYLTVYAILNVIGSLVRDK